LVEPRTWRRPHIGIEEGTHAIVAALVTTDEWSDNERERRFRLDEARRSGTTAS
jgi:hypothetical protein